MTKNQQIWLAIVALIALYLWHQKKNNPYGIGEALKTVPLSASALPADTFNEIISMQGASISIGY